MSSLKFFYSRLRTEEKLLFKAAEKLGVSFEFIDVRNLTWPYVNIYPGDIAVGRVVSQFQNQALSQLLESKGIRTVNPSSVVSLCGDKVATAAALQGGGIPQPEYRVAFSADQAIQAAEEMGYPVVFKPPVGSWGRLLARMNDRDAVEALVEHKTYMGSQHQVFFIQKYIEKDGWDLRATVIGGKPVSAIKRCSEHWITNTARGARAEGFSLDSELNELLQKVYYAIGGDVLAVDLFQTSTGWLVNEVNGQPEFRSSIETTGVDLPELIVSHAWSLVSEHE